MDKYLGGLTNVAIQIYEPNDAVKEILQKEKQQLSTGWETSANVVQTFFSKNP